MHTCRFEFFKFHFKMISLFFKPEAMFVCLFVRSLVLFSFIDPFPFNMGKLSLGRKQVTDRSLYSLINCLSMNLICDWSIHVISVTRVTLFYFVTTVARPHIHSTSLSQPCLIFFLTLDYMSQLDQWLTHPFDDARRVSWVKVLGLSTIFIEYDLSPIRFAFDHFVCIRSPFSFSMIYIFFI